jgi:hypothetical protein
MTVDPRIGMWLSIALAIIGFLSGAGTQLTAIFGPNATNIILASSVLLMGLGNAVNAVLHMIPSGPNKSSEFPLGPTSGTKP